jgi:hypothetical protein
VPDLVSTAVDETISARAAALAPWLKKLSALSAQSDLSELQFLDQVDALIRSMPAEMLTAENIAALAGPLEGALGAAAVNALLSAGERKP